MAKNGKVLRRGKRTMSFRFLKTGAESEEGEKTLYVKISESLAEYIETSRAKASADYDRKVSQREIVVGALEQDRDLGEKLTADSRRIGAFAKRHGLQMPRDSAEILARLVRKGLESDEG